MSEKRLSKSLARSRRDLLRGLAFGGGAVALAGAGCVPGEGAGAPDAGPEGPDAGTTDAPTTRLDVRSFGAVGDGATDDTDAIQATLDAAAAAAMGAVVYIPSGIYLVSNCLLIGSRTRVVGDGAGLSILRGAVPTYLGKVVNGHEIYATLACVATSNCLIEKLTVDHATNQTWANGIIFVPDGDQGSGTPCSYGTVQDCQVLGFNAHEYLIWNLRGKHIKILNNLIDGGVGSADPTSVQEGVESFGGYDVLIRGNTILRVGNAGINIGAGVGVPDSDCVGIRAALNYIKACRTGIYLGTSWDEESGPQDLSQIQLTENVVIGSWDDGIRVNTNLPGTALTDILIARNSIADALTGITLYGIEGETNHHGVFIDGNTITESRTTTGGGISAFFIANLVISHNSVADSANAAIWLHGASNATIAGNSLDTAGANGIACNLCSGLIVSDNRLHRYNDDDLDRPGLLLTAITRGVVRDNTFFEENDALPLVVDSASDQVTVAGNALMYASSAASPFVLLGSNSNVGVATMSTNATSIDVMNTLANGGSRFLVTQESGAIQPFRVTPIAGGFRITIPAEAVGGETFRWEILQ